MKPFNAKAVNHPQMNWPALAPANGSSNLAPLFNGAGSSRITWWGWKLKIIPVIGWGEVVQLYQGSWDVVVFTPHWRFSCVADMKKMEHIIRIYNNNSKNGLLPCPQRPESFGCFILFTFISFLLLFLIT